VPDGDDRYGVCAPLGAPLEGLRRYGACGAPEVEVGGGGFGGGWAGLVGPRNTRALPGSGSPGWCGVPQELVVVGLVGGALVAGFEGVGVGAEVSSGEGLPSWSTGSSSSSSARRRRPGVTRGRFRHGSLPDEPLPFSSLSCDIATPTAAEPSARRQPGVNFTRPRMGTMVRALPAPAGWWFRAHSRSAPEAI